MKEIIMADSRRSSRACGSRESGLTDEQVRRSEKCGWNELAEGKKKVFCRSSLNSIRIFWC